MLGVVIEAIVRLCRQWSQQGSLSPVIKTHHHNLPPIA